MPIVLYKIDLSPPARSVLMVIELLGLKVETKEVNTLLGEHLKPEYLQKNPLHTIPFLEDGDFGLAESHAIITYLVSKYGAEKRAILYPGDLRTRATIDQRLYFDNSYLFPKIRVLVLEVIKRKATGPPAELVAEIEEAYGFLEAYLQGTRFLVCDHITLADVSCVASVSTLNLFVPINERYPKLMDWLNWLKEEDWYQKGNAPGLAQAESVFRQMMENNNV